MESIEQIYNWLKSSKSIVITAGAGMGRDSGLADYRGDGGQWGQIEKELDKSIFEIVNPNLFIENPKFAWEMFSARLIEYTNTIPHDGFNIILKWINQFDLDYFVLTSNIDNQFQKAGFNEFKIRELHGSVFYLQCSKPCSDAIWEHNMDLNTIKSEIEVGNYPKCPKCGAISRPNVYLFRDSTYLPSKTNTQKERFNDFIEKNKKKEILVLEIGSGPHVQSIRKKTRMLAIEYNAKIIRINPYDNSIKPPHIALSKGALESLLEIEAFINKQD